MSDNKKVPQSPEISEGTRNAAYAKYVTCKEDSLFNHMGCSTVVWVMLFAWNMMFGIFTPQFDKEDVKEQKISVAGRFNQRVRDVFYPVSNGWHPSLIPVPSESVLRYNIRYKYDESFKGDFKPRAVWYTNMLCLLVAAYWLFVSTAEKNKNQRTNAKQKATVDVMLEFGLKGSFDSNKLASLMPIAVEIVSKMSRDDSAYFKKLVDSDFLTKLKHDRLALDIAMEIMAAHLDSCPKDMGSAIKACSESMAMVDMLMNKLRERTKYE